MTTPRPVLLLGFGPFRTVTRNPSGLIAQRLDRVCVDGHPVVGRQLQVVSRKIGRTLDELCRAVDPGLILVIGLARGRSALALERVAVNVLDFPTPDTEGVQAVDEPVVVGGPDAFLSQIAIKRVLMAWRAAELNGYVSNTAGTYVCNQTFYLACAAAQDRGIHAGMVHLPSTPDAEATVTERSDGEQPTMSYEELECAVRLAMHVSLRYAGSDAALAAGSDL